MSWPRALGVIVLVNALVWLAEFANYALVDVIT